jgi:hypothetical protein
MRSEEETIDAATLREQLRHVYWIGGGSCAGKSTIARRIADQHGLNLYPTDDVMAEHSRRIKPEECPLLHQFMAMDADDRWVNRSPITMLDTFHWFRGEGFNMIIGSPPHPDSSWSDRGGLPGIAVSRKAYSLGFGSCCLAPPVTRVPPSHNRAAGRMDVWVSRQNKHPERALQNLLERDRMLTDRLRKEVEDLELRAIQVNTPMAEEDSASLVAKIFGL